MKKYKHLAWLKKNYIDGDMTDKQIASLCNVSARTIRWWREKFRIIKKRKVNMKIKYLRIQIPFYYYESIQEYCDYKKLSMSSVIRTALVEFSIRNKINFYK